MPDKKFVQNTREMGFRPTLSKTRQGIFNSLSNITDFEGKSFLDAFAGSAIMGIEAVSRGFNTICAIEKNIKIAKIAKENYANFDINVDFYIGDTLKILNTLQSQFDVIFIDPPYNSGVYEGVLKIIKEKNLLKNTDGIIILETDLKFRPEDAGFAGFNIIKEKNYADTKIMFLKYLI